MERWDFDCQVCGINIGNYAYVRPYWYKCLQEENVNSKGDKIHKVRGRGWGRLGYTLCRRCAIKNMLKCDICGGELTKITADEHPGGHWGIREFSPRIDSGLMVADITIIRKPAPIW